jgi:hypothetical protein
VSSERLGAERFVVALVAVPVVPAIAYLLAVTLLAVPRMRFHVGARRFEVRTLFGARMWPAEGMTATRRTPRFERRLFGTSMPGYATGWFLLDGKRTRVYATTRQDGVLLESADSRIFVTPADVPSMLEALHHAGVTSGRSDATRPPGGTMSELSSPGPIRWSRILIGTLVLGAPVVLLVIRLLPSFRHSGSLVVGEVPFEPAECHVLAGEAGIELSDVNGTRISLGLPASRSGPGAWATVGGAARVTRTLAGQSLDVGLCGTLVLTGEGFHASGKRAVKGRLSLACAASEVRGDLTFEGCF